MYGSYISSRMLTTFSYGLNFSRLPKRDNLHIKDKRPAPNLSVIRNIPSLAIYILQARIYLVSLYIYYKPEYT